MPKRKRLPHHLKKALDPVPEKRRRGRPEKISRATVTGRAENYRRMFAAVWAGLSSPLLAAETKEQVIAAFESHAEPYTNRFVPHLASDILDLIHDRQFPKRAKAQVRFLADSLPGRPEITARTSRDICAKHRAIERAKSPHRILRKEFYVECSCGYRGPALNDACRKCGAQISYVSEILLGTRFG